MSATLRTNMTLRDDYEPPTLTTLRPIKRESCQDSNDSECFRVKKKLKVNFNLMIDIKSDPSDDACVPQGPPSLSDFSDVESLAEPIPTTPGGKPQVWYL